MADLQGFRTMLAERAESEKGLPHVCLRESSDFSMALARLVTVDNRNNEESDAQVTQRYLDEFCQSLGEEANKEVADSFNQAIEAFKTKISSAIKSVNEIRDASKKLAAIIETGIQDYLARDPFVSTHMNLTKLSTDFPEWTWEGTKVFGSKTYLVERVNAQFVGEGVTPPTDFDYKLFMFGISTAAERIKFAVIENFPSTTKEQVIDQLVEAVGATVTKENIEKVVNYLIGDLRMNGLINELQRLQSQSPAELFHLIKQYDEMIRTFFPVADAIATKTIKIPELESATAFVENAEKMIKFCEYIAYFEYMERETVYRDAVLLQGSLMNSDAKSDFESQGGTQLMLAHYIRYMFKDDPEKIPARGVSGKVIIESAAHNEKIVKADMVNITNRIVLATTNAKVSVFKTAAHRYAVNKIDRECAESTPVDRSIAVDRIMTTTVRKIADRILENDIAIVDACLMLIVEADYSGTFVEQMYKELGAAYLAKMQTADGDVSDMDLRVAEMGVVAKMVAGFVVDQIIVPCQCKEMVNHSPVVPVNGDAM